MMGGIDMKLDKKPGAAGLQHLNIVMKQELILRLQEIV